MTKSPDLNGGTRHLTVILQRLAGIALALAYGTLCLMVIPPIGQAIGVYLFGIHLISIGLTVVIAAVGVFRGSRVCIYVLIAVAPLVYAQFLSGLGTENE